MSYRLVILGVLAEQPHYGYDLKQTIEQQYYAEYIRLSGGGLYYHLRKLQEEGYIEEQMVEREGKYPDRHIYRITDQGRTYLIELLRATLDDVVGRRTYDPLDAALSFAFLLPHAEVLARLQHQLDVLQGQISVVEVLQQKHRQIIEHASGRMNSAVKRESLYRQIIIDHKLAFGQHEVRWLQEMIRSIEEQCGREMDEEPSVLDAEAETSLSRQVLADSYVLFQHLQPSAKEALVECNLQVEQAWQEYQRQMTTHSDSELRQAHQAYQQRVAKIKQIHKEKLRRVLGGEEGEHS